MLCISLVNVKIAKWISFWYCCSIGFYCSNSVAFLSEDSGTVPTEPLFYICMFFVVVFFTIVPLFLNLYALKGINSSAVGIMIYINPIITFLVAIFFL